MKFFIILIFLLIFVFGIVLGIVVRLVIENFIFGIFFSFFFVIWLGDIVVIDGYYGMVEDIFMLYMIVKIWDWK